MDISTDVDSTSLSRRPSTLTSSPPVSTHSASAASSPQLSIFSYNYRSKRGSTTSSSISSVGDNGQNEGDGAYYSDSDPQDDATRLSTVASEGRYDEALASPRSLLQAELSAYHARPSGLPRPVTFGSPVPLNCRQNPRRTHRWSRTAPTNGALPEARPPPSLVRQSERKDSFVESLVDTTTLTVEIIWPLSIAQGRAGADQNILGLRTYVCEVLKRSKTSYSTLLLTLYYLVVVMSGLPKDDFTMEQTIDSDGFRALQCGRRMFLAALILASKYLQDRNFSTKAWSKISGLPVSEINNNERVFLATVNWQLHMPEPLFQRMEKIVLKYSPAGHTPSIPRSSPAACQTWRSVVRQMNSALDQFNDNGMLLSDNDSGYYSETSAPSSRDSSPHTLQNSPAAPIVVDVPPVPVAFSDLPPLTLEPPLQDSQPEFRMPPPMQPREGPLPTPQITPNIRSFRTPAVSASGLLPRRPSMSLAVNEHRRCLEDSLLDCANAWQSRSNSIPHRQFHHVPSSLSNYSSSPDSVSDLSLYPSRSSSISSVASSNCALLEPNLAAGAMRRCANLKMSALVDNSQSSHDDGAAGNMVPPILLTSPGSRGSDFYFKERPKKLVSEGNSKTGSIARLSNVEDLPLRTLTAGDDDSTPKPAFSSIKVVPSPNSQTYQAAAALVDLTLNQNTASIPERTPKTGENRKRGRPLSINIGFQSSVRGLVQSPSLEEARSDDCDGIVIVPDEVAADSWLLKGGSGSSYRKDDELWATFDRGNNGNNRWDNRAVAGQPMSCRSVNTSSESLPRKKACTPLRLDISKNENVRPGLSVRRGGGNISINVPTAKTARKTSATAKNKSRGSRKPSAEMNHMLKNEPLLYGELRHW